MRYLNTLFSLIFLFYSVCLSASSTPIESVFGSSQNKKKSDVNYKSVEVFNPEAAQVNLEKQKQSVDVVNRKENPTVKQQASNVFGTSTASTNTSNVNVANDKSDFLWPIYNGGGTFSSGFGWRSSTRFHDGIDISAPAGTKIIASKSGKVIYSSAKIRGYGNMIVLKHENNYYTVYAHNRQNLVKVGEQVSKGAVIAYLGRTGRASGDHLHFEVRKGKFSVDPMKYVSKPINKKRELLTKESEKSENKIVSTFTN